MSEKAGRSEEVYFFSLIWQRFVNWLFFPILSVSLILVMKYYAGYKIKQRKEIRKKFRAAARERGNYPLLICPNHLTMIDSVILEWAFAGPLWYWFHFRQFPWNIPAVENFKTNYLSRTITYLGKCIPIDRKGGKEHTDLVMKKVEFLLKRGDAFLIFPEGTRSRSGRFQVEEIAYGVGKLIQEIGTVAVLCVYLRGDSQITYSDFPAKGESFYVDMELIWPRTDKTGIRGQRDLSLQIGETIKKLENKYFSKENIYVNRK